MLRGTTRAIVLVLLSCIGPVSAPAEESSQPSGGLNANEVAAALGDTSGRARLSAIQSLEPSMTNGLGGAELATILGDTSGSYRARMIEVIASHARNGLDASEVVAALGKTTRRARLDGISALEPKIRHRLTGGDIAKIVGDSTGSYRAKMIEVLASHVGDGSSTAGTSQTDGDATGRQYRETETVLNPAEPRDSSRNLSTKIDRLLAAVPDPPEYLYDVSTRSDAISMVFMDLTSWVRGAEGRRKAYDEFYHAAVEYLTLAELELIYARRALDGSDPELAQRRYDRAARYLKQARATSEATLDVYQGDLKSATTLAKTTYELSKAAAKFGSHFAPSPATAHVIDALFTATDFYVNQSDVGLAGAAQELVIDLTVDAVMHAPIDDFGEKSLAQALEDRTTKLIGSSGLYEILGRVSDDPDFKARIMRELASSGAATANMITEYQLEAVLRQVRTAGAPSEGSHPWTQARKHADGPRITRHDDEHTLFLPRPMKDALRRFDPEFVVRQESDYPAVVVGPWNGEEGPQRYQFSERQAPFAVIGDFNGDGVNDVVLEGDTRTRYRELAVVSEGERFRVLDVRSGPANPRYHDIMERIRARPRSDAYDGAGPILTLVQPGIVESAYEEQPLRLGSAAIQVSWLEKGAWVVYYASGGFQKYVVSD